MISQTDIEDRRKTRSALRFGIMCDGPVFDRFRGSCVEQLLAGPGTEPALLIMPEREKTDGIWRRIRTRPHGGYGAA